MKKLWPCIIVGFLFIASLSAQDKSKPFAEFERELNREPAGWAGDKGRLSTVFNSERKRLADNFEAELWKYLDSDAEKHYWIASFLEEPTYLHGNKPLLELSLRIITNGIGLTKDKIDESSVALTFRFNISAALISHRLNLPAQAILYKSKADAMLAADNKLRLYFAAMSKEDLRIYQSLNSDGPPTIVSAQTSSEFTDQPAARISGGILNAKATTFPIPKYPDAARKDKASGRIVVRVVVDEQGKVIWARAIDGHPALMEAATNAALKAKFKPTVLSGKPERVAGILVYAFIYGS